MIDVLLSLSFFTIFFFSVLLLSLFVDTPALSVSSFPAYDFKHASTQSERQRLAAELIANVGLYGGSGTNPEGIVDPALARQGILFTQKLFYPKISAEARKELCRALAPFGPTSEEKDLGIFQPGSEGYGEEREWYKIFFRYGLRGPQRAFTNTFFPDVPTLAKYLPPEDAEFIVHFATRQEGLWTLHHQVVELTTIALDAIAECYFGLELGYWRQKETVTFADETRSYDRVKDCTSQPTQYLLQHHRTGVGPFPEDVLFRRHVDSSAGTNVIPSETFEEDASEDDYRLTIEAADGQHIIRPVVQKGHFVFQFGKNFAVTVQGLANAGRIPHLDNLPYGLLKATPHWAQRGPNLHRSRASLPTFVHPDLEMLLVGTSNPKNDGRLFTAGDILSGDLDAYIDAQR